MIKLWSPFALPNSIGGLDEESTTARVPYKSFFGLQVSSHSTNEDQQVLAFFDIMDSVTASGNDNSASYQRHICMGLMEFLLSRALASMEQGGTDGDSGDSSDTSNGSEDEDEQSSDEDEDEDWIDIE